MFQLDGKTKSKMGGLCIPSNWSRKLLGMVTKGFLLGFLCHPAYADESEGICSKQVKAAAKRVLEAAADSPRFSSPPKFGEMLRAQGKQVLSFRSYTIASREEAYIAYFKCSALSVMVVFDVLGAVGHPCDLNLDLSSLIVQPSGCLDK